MGAAERARGERSTPQLGAQFTLGTDGPALGSSERALGPPGPDGGTDEGSVDCALGGLWCRLDFLVTARYSTCYEVKVKEVTVLLKEEEFEKLRGLASDLGLAPEELARLGLEDLLAQPEESVRKAIAFVLEKNRDLYRRLA